MLFFNFFDNYAKIHAFSGQNTLERKDNFANLQFCPKHVTILFQNLTINLIQWSSFLQNG